MAGPNDPNQIAPGYSKPGGGVQGGWPGLVQRGASSLLSGVQSAADWMQKTGSENTKSVTPGVRRSQGGAAAPEPPSGGDFTPPSTPVASASTPVASASTPKPFAASPEPAGNMHPLLEQAFKNPSMWQDTPSRESTQPSLSMPMLQYTAPTFSNPNDPADWGGINIRSLGQIHAGGGQESRGPAGAPGVNMAKGIEAQAALTQAESNKKFPSEKEIGPIREAAGLSPILNETKAFPHLAAAAGQPGFDATKMARIASLGEVDLNNPEHRKMLGAMAIQHGIDPIKAAAGPNAFQRNVWGRTPETIEASKFWQHFNQLNQGSGAGVP